MCAHDNLQNSTVIFCFNTFPDAKYGTFCIPIAQHRPVGLFVLLSKHEEPYNILGNLAIAQQRRSQETDMRYSTVILMSLCLVLSNPAFSQIRKTAGNLGASKQAQIRPQAASSVRMRREVQLQQSKFKGIHSQATMMARQDLNPQIDYEGELITTLKVLGRQTDALSRSFSADMDIDELAQLVMFELWASEDEHLEDLLEDMHKTNRIKQKQRELIGALSRQKGMVRKSLIDALNGAPQDVRPVKKVTLSRKIDLVSGPGAKTVVGILTDVQGSEIGVSWIPGNGDTNASLILNGPGKVGHYQRKVGKGTLKMLQEVTPAVSKQGRLWQVSLSIPETTPCARATGRLTVTYMAHYSPNARRVSGGKAKALKQTQGRFDQLMYDSFAALSNIKKNYPQQSSDFAVRETIRHINKVSNLFGTVGLATESRRLALQLPTSSS